MKNFLKTHYKKFIIGAVIALLIAVGALMYVNYNKKVNNNPDIIAGGWGGDWGGELWKLTGGNVVMMVKNTWNLLIGGEYINFGSNSGESGYGIKDNTGILQFKNSGGEWADLGSGSESIFDQNIIIVNINGEEVEGKSYTTIADALIFIATQSPAEDNRWMIKLGAGEYDENFVVPDWVLIKGSGQATTILSGEIKSGGTMLVIPTDIYKNAIEDATIENLYFDNIYQAITLFNCMVRGGSDTSDASLGAILFAYDTNFFGGIFDQLSQIQIYRGFIVAGTFSASLLHFYIGSILIPEGGNISIGGTVEMVDCFLFYTFLSNTLTFTNTTHTTTLKNTNYYINNLLGVTAPIFNTANRVYNFYNSYLGSATFTAGTFNQYNTSNGEKNSFFQVEAGGIYDGSASPIGAGTNSYRTSLFGQAYNNGSASVGYAGVLGYADATRDASETVGFGGISSGSTLSIGGFALVGSESTPGAYGLYSNGYSNGGMLFVSQKGSGPIAQFLRVDATVSLQIENDGTISTAISTYENLVTNDNDIPNKKYVDNEINGIIKQANFVIYADGDWDNEAVPIWLSPSDNITIKEVRAVTFGTSPSLTWNIEERYWGSAGSAGANIFSSDITTTESGTATSTISTPGISAYSHLIFTTESSAETGTVDVIQGVIYYTKD